MLTTMAHQVAVIGSGAEWEDVAEEVGRLLAERGCTVVTGGLDEVMAAAHRGAKSVGGTTLAILPGEISAANPWADHVVVTGSATRGTSRWRLPATPSSRSAAATGRSPRWRSRFGWAGASSPSTGRPTWRAWSRVETAAEAVELALRDLG